MLPQGLGPDAKPSRESPCPDHTQARVSKSLMRGGVFLQLVALFLGWAPWLCLCPMVHGGWPDSAHEAAWPLLAAPSPALGVLAMREHPLAVQRQANVGGLPFPWGIPHCSMSWGFPRDEASPVGHSLYPGSRLERNWPSFAFKIRFQLKMPGVPDAGLIFKQHLGGGQ